MAALSSAPRCPSAAEVAATPLMPYPSQPSAGKLRRCYGLPAHPPLRPTARRRIGVLITVTAEKMNAVACLRTLLQTDPALRPHHVLVTVDFTNKSRAADAAARRRAWAADNARELHAAADALHAMARAPVLLELVELGSCMGEYLMRHVFQCVRCHSARMWKNTVAFAWGLARLAACVTHVVHVDNDILLRRLPSRAANASWVERAVAVLEANESLMSVHPTRGGGPACGARQGLPYCRCANKLAHKMDVRWAGPATRQSGGLYFLHSARQPLADAREACLLTYVGPHKPDVPHFSIQAFVLDVTRFQRIFPLNVSHALYDGNSSSVGERARAAFLTTFEMKHGIVRAEGRVDPESIFEERARSVGLGVVYMAPSELGIEKIVNPRRGSSALG